MGPKARYQLDPIPLVDIINVELKAKSNNVIC